jgi:hypothetical protein
LRRVGKSFAETVLFEMSGRRDGVGKHTGFSMNPG